MRDLKENISKDFKDLFQLLPVSSFIYVLGLVCNSPFVFSELDAATDVIEPEVAFPDWSTDQIERPEVVDPETLVDTACTLSISRM